MVSIPDWARFARMLEGKPAAKSHSKYARQREVEAIRQAEEQGYFLNASKKFLEETFAPGEIDGRDSLLLAILGEKKEPRDLNKVFMLKLTSSHLRTIGDIGLCANLTICILSGNYLTRIDGLANCCNLMKLDLHNNQIGLLPGPAFWANLIHLRILHLHDNPIGKIESLHHLASCPELNILTMSDTPLSLKRNYRHHVVNSIWTLKALDNYVVSDEEIIEDAEFGSKFGTLAPAFMVDLCPPTPEDTTYFDELAVINSVNHQINLILAHYSPVIIVQRFIRGHLARKQYRLLQDMRIWAAVTIQRQYRNWKGMSAVDEQETVPPPPTSPINAEDVQPTAPDAIKMDYDTYLQNRRPGSGTGISETSTVSRYVKDPKPRLNPKPGSDNKHNLCLWIRYHGGDDDEINKIIERALFGEMWVPSTNVVFDLDAALSKLRVEPGGTGKKPGGSAKQIPDGPIASLSSEETPDGRQKKNIFINLTKLHSGTLQSLQDEAQAMDSMWPGRGTDHYHQYPRYKQRPKEEGPKKRIIKNVKQFFGPVVSRVNTPGAEQEDTDTIPIIDFRLRGMKNRIEVIDPMAELIMMRAEAGHEVRLAEAEYHRKTDNPTKPTIKRNRLLPRETRIFHKIQGNMGLSCLRAVQQAYQDREVAEKSAQRIESVLGMRDGRETGKDRVKLFREERRAQIMKDRDRDQKRLLEVMEKQELARINQVDHSITRKTRSSHFSKSRRGERSFVYDFNVQNTSVSNALMRHDRQAQHEDALQTKSEVVQVSKNQEKEQQEIVRKFLEHRQLMRQTESAMARSSLDAQMLQEANDRLMQARNRVAQQRARYDNIQGTVTLPLITTPQMTMTPKSATKPEGEQWNGGGGGGGVFLTQGQRSTTVS